MSRYAENTGVDSSKSRAEIERTLVRYGANGFMYGWNEGDAMVAFQMEGRHIKFVLPLPSRDDFAETPTGKDRAPKAIEAAYEQAVRQKWRALSLVIKAKLEAIESVISTFDEEFMAHIVLPNGDTVAEFMVPQIEAAYLTGGMPKLLAAPKKRARRSPVSR